jgi:competence protein ComEA
MEGFLSSFQPLWEKYKSEIVLLLVSIILIIISIQIYFSSVADEKQTESLAATPTIKTPSPTQKKTQIYVEISGEVNKPDVYLLEQGARLNDLVKMAGGLSDSADKGFFSRNFNLAKILADQDKVYVPSIYEITNGLFIEQQKNLDYLNPVSTNIIDEEISTKGPESPKIAINKAESEELQLLPGVGEATANKIINNRPYTKLEELISKKVVSKRTFENIKNLIQLD